MTVVSGYMLVGLTRSTPSLRVVIKACKIFCVIIEIKIDILDEIDISVQTFDSLMLTLHKTY